MACADRDTPSVEGDEVELLEMFNGMFNVPKESVTCHHLKHTTSSNKLSQNSRLWH